MRAPRCPPLSFIPGSNWPDAWHGAWHRSCAHVPRRSGQGEKDAANLPCCASHPTGAAPVHRSDGRARPPARSSPRSAICQPGAPVARAPSPTFPSQALVLWINQGLRCPRRSTRVSQDALEDVVQHALQIFPGHGRIAHGCDHRTVERGGAGPGATTRDGWILGLQAPAGLGQQAAFGSPRNPAHPPVGGSAQREMVATGSQAPRRRPWLGDCVRHLCVTLRPTAEFARQAFSINRDLEGDWLGDLDSNQGFPSQSRKFYR